MTDYRRKSTVRDAFRKSIAVKTSARVGKLKGKYLFRAAVRLVIQYKEWIEDVSEEKIGDDVTANVKLAQRKKVKSEDEELTLKDRAVLLTAPDKRTKEDVAHIERLLRDIKAFKRYPEKVRESLASECAYQYVPAGRTITRQGHETRALYYIVKGQVQIFKDEADSLTGELRRIDVGILVPGDVFGEIALLHKIPRTATVVSKTATDLLIIQKRAFNAHVRSVLLEEWAVLKDALVNFNYFKGWTDDTMLECCILSKIVTFKPNEIVLGDGKGMIHYVYFLLSGECRLIEHMLIEKRRVGKTVKYKMFKSDQDDVNPRQRVGRAAKIDLSESNLQSLIMESVPELQNTSDVANREPSSAADYIKMVSEKKSNTAMDRLSVTTVTLQDVINQWHEITDTVEMLMKKLSVSSLRRYPPHVQTVFMQICIFYRGACFGLGEQMKNRRIVSITGTKCLLIPRYWLTQHNRANIWERVKHFMNSKLLGDKELFRKYVENRKWAKYRREYCENVLTNGRIIPNDNKIYNVPYSIRINENIVDE
ncbi:cGMP-dependent protein kinase-like [Phymastichus coffea]|uniref:cGMP-dependent protein kinase-like n=1 Tax=Phymastichus coffea TaxID=108790 RepID=UPI00273B69E7|nr:cGMP-dependent protein kinase-like [Phymastichus coffea]